MEGCLSLLRIPYQKSRFLRTANQMHAKWIWLAVLKDSLRTANQIDRGFLMQPMRLLVLMNSLRVTKTSISYGSPYQVLLLHGLGVSTFSQPLSESFVWLRTAAAVITRKESMRKWGYFQFVGIWAPWPLAKSRKIDTFEWLLMASLSIKFTFEGNYKSNAHHAG